MNNEIKSLLYQFCADFVQNRINHIESANKTASESANDETKNSSGDKHETGRAMAQLEQEKNSKQLDEALKLKKILSQINPAQSYEKIQAGSLVFTNKGNFYIAISAGKIIIENEIYFSVSPLSPIANKLLGLKKGTSFEMNSQQYTILNVI